MFDWLDNPWIVDTVGCPLKARNLQFLKQCRIGDLGIKRVSKMTYTFKPPALPSWPSAKGCGSNRTVNCEM